jgi:hypothetical protein
MLPQSGSAAAQCAKLGRGMLGRFQPKPFLSLCTNSRLDLLGRSRDRLDGPVRAHLTAAHCTFCGSTASSLRARFFEYTVLGAELQIAHRWVAVRRDIDALIMPHLQGCRGGARTRMICRNRRKPTATGADSQYLKWKVEQCLGSRSAHCRSLCTHFQY